MSSPFIGPTYALGSKPASVQRTVNMTPVPLEPGNEREGWVFKDVPGLVSVSRNTVLTPSQLTCADAADTVAIARIYAQVGYMYQYRLANPGGGKPVGMIPDVTVIDRQAGSIAYPGSAFPIFKTINWSDLVSGANKVNYFSSTRDGVAPDNTTSYNLTIQNLPAAAGGCRVLVFQTYYAWASFPVYINSATIMSGGLPYSVPDARTGNGVGVGSSTPGWFTVMCILKLSFGVLTATYYNVQTTP